MAIFLTIMQVIAFLGFATSIYLFFRNEQVASYRRNLINDACDSGMISSESWRKWYESVSYDEMIWKFWKPVNSFYKDRV